jgi:hypothetical protein
VAKCALVSQLLTRGAAPELDPQEDFGGVIEDIAQTAALNDSPPSQYDFRKSVKAMRATVRYSVGIHSTINKSDLPTPCPSLIWRRTVIPPGASLGDSPTSQGTQTVIGASAAPEASSPTKSKQTVKMSSATSARKEGTIDSIMHMEALDTIGLSQRELEEKRQLDKQKKHKLGIPPSEYFEKNRDENSSTLMKVRRLVTFSLTL